MHKLIAIAVAAALAAAVSVTVTLSAHAPDAERAGIVMPSILQVMTEAGELPRTPIVSP